MVVVEVVGFEVVVVVEDVVLDPLEQAGNTSSESIRMTEITKTNAGNLGCFTFLPPFLLTLLKGIIQRTTH